MRQGPQGIVSKRSAHRTVQMCALSLFFETPFGIADGMSVARVWVCWYSKLPPRPRVFQRRVELAYILMAYAVMAYMAWLHSYGQQAQCAPYHADVCPHV